MKDAGGARAVAARLLERPKRLLTTVLLGNMVVNVVFYSVSFVLLVQYRESLGALGASLLGAAAPLVLILFCELLPKNVAVLFSRPVSRAAARPLAGFQRVAWPAIFVFERAGGGLSRLFAPRTGPEPLIHADELAMLADLSAREGVIDQDAGQMITAVVKLSETAIRETMVPRVDMACFNLSSGAEELEALFSDRKHTLIPAYEDQVDNIVGVIHAKDFLLRGEAQDMRSLLRPLIFLPETTTVEEALNRFRREQTRMGIVVDEYGAVVGLVTLEDMLEEIVGEIADEHDKIEPPEIEPIGERLYRVRGDASVNELEECCAVRLPDVSVDTVGGLVMALLDRVPRTGDEVSCGPMHIKVELARGHRVVSVLVSMAPGQGGPAGPGRRGADG